MRKTIDFDDDLVKRIQELADQDHQGLWTHALLRVVKKGLYLVRCERQMQEAVGESFREVMKSRPGAIAKAERPELCPHCGGDGGRHYMMCPSNLKPGEWKPLP